MKHLLPKETWALIQQQPDVLFLDVRMEIESQYVGRPPGVVNIPWYDCPDFKPNPAAFVQAVEKIAKSKDQPVVLICRSGLRSVDGGRVLEQAGFSQVINVLDGFEGELDDNDQRGTESGWRFDGLPWTQT
ncbi:MAG: rhodanese-like domain-containing protein [Rhodoferax sp.]|uniref:rhodanese-like domain-containing protein n=1 Tax=Rhodoferax sp. TaxID=50421 RepID=UPI003019D55A